MRDGWAIANEPDPYLREIYALGWDEVHFDMCTQSTILLHNKSREERRIQLHGGYFKIKDGILPDGRIHKWIAEADGSAQRFRGLVGRPKATEGTAKNE